MSIFFNGNVNYEGTKPFVAREQYATKQLMEQADKRTLNSGLIAYCIEDKKHYKFIRENDGVGHENTGSWQELTPSEVNSAVIQAIATAKQEAKQEAIDDAEGKFVKKTEEKTLEVESQGLTHTLKFGGQTVGTISIPQDVFANGLEYIADQKKLKITLSNGQFEEVDLTALIDTYTAGTGLQVQGNEFSLTTEYTALPGKVQALEAKVQTLEAKPSYELGFVKTGNKLPVAEEGNKLFVEVEIPQAKTYEKATEQADGLMSKEHFAKVQAWQEKIFVVTEQEFQQAKQAQTLVADGIYFIKD